MSLITTTVNVEVVEVPHECVIGAGLWRILGVQIYPFVLESLILGQVVEVVASFARVSAEEKYTVLKC